MKKLFLLCVMALAWSHQWVLAVSYGQKEVSVKYYPKAVAYFENLRLKYPTALPASVLIVIGQVAGPCATDSEIIFPLSWIAELEEEKALTLAATEWILLHEAGHIYHAHRLKFLAANSIALFVGLTLIYANAPESLSSFENIKTCFKGISIISGIGHLAYSRWKMEPQADDFANEHCDNLAAFKAAVEWMEKMEFDGFTHPSMQSRIDKMNKVMLQKFGYKEEVLVLVA